ncbi:MAG TPA: serine hydrolase domain-containing protein [Rhizomicrobium sp.]|jgi:CubicO group peptidase (beta-lactamase class C family)|nr:serine hydrolase domain-containing protein [Rhizomicrobium sp.]
MKNLGIACGAALLLLTIPAAAKPKAVHAAPAMVLAPATPDAEGFDAARLARLTAAMHGQVDDGQLVGIQTMLVRHGRVVSFDTYGKASLVTGAPLKPDAIFRLYSQTKPTIGVAMMILFEEGKWRLEDPVTKYVPEFANLKVFTGIDSDGKPILEDMKHVPTMRELITHTAGFGYGLESDNYVDKQFQAQHVLSSNGLQDMINKIATIPLRYQPGTRWSYSAGVDIQGYIIEKLSGMRLSDFMQKNIYGPLGMKDTGFVVPPEKVSRLAAANAVVNGKMIEITPAMTPLLQDFTKPPAMDSGGGGSLGTAADYARFCQMILNHGELNGVRILSPASVALLESDQIEPTVVPYDEKGRAPIGTDALGFGVDFAIVKDPAKLGSLVGHGTIFWGGAAGTWFWIDPANDMFFLGMIQKFDRDDRTGNDNLATLSQTLVYQALTNPSR